MFPAYEEMLEVFYRSILRSGDTVIDIGAHIGRHTFPCAESVGGKGKIFCFEPLPAQYKKLSTLIFEKRGCGNFPEITPYNFALGEGEYETNFVVVPDFPEYSGFKERKYHAENLRKESIKVKVRTLDSFASEIGPVRYIKVDAEGGELMILRGATQIISKFQPIVSFELGNASLINYDYTAGDYFDFFRDMNYHVYSIFGIKLDREKFLEYADTQFFWDYIAIPASQAWPASNETIKILVSQISSAHSEQDFRKIVEAEARAKLAEAEARAKLAEAEARAKLAEAEVSAKLAEAGVSAKLAEANRCLQDILSSNSWRVTW